jgi:hypothetical protein
MVVRNSSTFGSSSSRAASGREKLRRFVKAVRPGIPRAQQLTTRSINVWHAIDVHADGWHRRVIGWRSND